MRSKYFYLWLVLYLLSGCHKETEKIPDNLQNPEIHSLFSSPDAIDGVIRVKLDRETADALATSLTKSGSPSAVLSFKEICDRYHIVRMERIFPKDEMEARTREAGLDLWYSVYFSEKEHSKTSVAEEFSKTAGVTQVEPVRKVKQVGRLRAPYHPDTLPVVPAKNQTASSLPFNDPYLPEQWNYCNDGSIHSAARAGADMDVFPCWEETAGNNEVIVAIVDEGVQYNHPDLQANMWSEIGYNFCDDTPDITWGEGHGTHVAGIIAAENNNHIGISGIAGGTGNKDGVKIMSCEIFNAHGKAASSNGCAQALKYGADHGAVICQNSWGYEAGVFSSEAAWSKNDGMIKEAIDYFITYAGRSADGKTQTGPMAGGVVIFSAGNDASSAPSFPAAYSSCISVASVSCNYQAAWYSNYGSTIDICAPGGGAWISHSGDIPYTQGYILSTLPTNLQNGDLLYDGNGLPYLVDYVKTPGYGYMQGTSMACPHISGLAALLVSKFGGPGFTNDQLKDILFNSTQEIDSYQSTAHKNQMGGLADAASAFQYYSTDLPLPQITPAEGQSSKIYLLNYETVSLSYHLQNYTSYQLTDASGNISVSKTGDQLTLSIPGKKYLLGNYTATLILNNRNQKAHLTLQYTIEKNVAPETVKPFENLCFSDAGITQSLSLPDYFTDANNDLSDYIATVNPYGACKVLIKNEQLQITSLQEGSGTIKVTARDKGGLSRTETFTVTVNYKNFPIDLYPNPCSREVNFVAGKLNGALLQTTARLSILNASGQEVLQQTLSLDGENPVKTDVSGLPSGRYLVKITCNIHNREMTSTQTLIKQ